MGKMEKLLSLDEVHRLIGRKPITLRLDIKKGRLKATRLGRQFRVHESELKRFLDARQKES